MRDYTTLPIFLLLVSFGPLHWICPNWGKTKPFLLMCQHKAPHREWAPALRHLGHDQDRVYPEPDTLFDDYAGRGKAEKSQDMTLEKTFTKLDAKLVYPPGMTDADKKKWDEYYKPRNEAFEKANPKGQDLVRWRYNRYLHDVTGCIKAVDEGVGVAFLGPQGRLLRGVLALGEPLAEVAGVEGDAEAGADQVGDAAGGPKVGGEAVAVFAMLYAFRSDTLSHVWKLWSAASPAFLGASSAFRPDTRRSLPETS